MTVKIVISDPYVNFSKILLSRLEEFNPTIEIYNEDNYKEKKRAIMIKASCGTRLTPFVAVYNKDRELIKAFYSDTNECNILPIIKFIKEYEV